MSPMTSPSTSCSYSSSSFKSPASRDTRTAHADPRTAHADPHITLASPQRGHANDVFQFVKLPLPPEIPPTKLKGVSVEQRVEQFESRAALESMLHSVGLAKGGSPLRNLEYTTDPHSRHSANVRVWDETDSDYERMELRDSHLYPAPHPQPHLYSDPSHYGQPNPYSDVLSGSMFSSLTLDEPLDSSVVQFTGKSGLFMSSSPTPMTSSPIKTKSVSSDKHRQKSGSMDSGYFEDDLYQRSISSKSRSKARLSSFSTIQSSKKSSSSSKIRSKLSTFLCHTASDVTDGDTTSSSHDVTSSFSEASSESTRHDQAFRHQVQTTPSDPYSFLEASTDSLLTDSMYEVIKPRPASTHPSSRSSRRTRPSDIDDHLKTKSSTSTTNVVQFTSKSSLLYKPTTKTSYTAVYRPSDDVASTVSSMYEVLTDNKSDDYYQMLDCGYEPKKLPKKPKRRVSVSHYENL